MLFYNSTPLSLSKTSLSLSSSVPLSPLQLIFQIILPRRDFLLLRRAAAPPRACRPLDHRNPRSIAAGTSIAPSAATYHLAPVPIATSEHSRAVPAPHQAAEQRSSSVSARRRYNYGGFARRRRLGAVGARV